jgi:hypothetical protein
VRHSFRQANASSDSGTLRLTRRRLALAHRNLTLYQIGIRQSTIDAVIERGIITSC